MSVLRRVAVTVGLALALVGATAVPAAADSAACTPGCAGYAYFVSYGEHLCVEDRAADGHSAVAHHGYYRGSTWVDGYLWNPYGAFNRRVERNFDIPEGAGFVYEVCLGEYGSRTVLWSTCSAVVSDRA